MQACSHKWSLAGPLWLSIVRQRGIVDKVGSMWFLSFYPTWLIPQPKYTLTFYPAASYIWTILGWAM